MCYAERLTTKVLSISAKILQINPWISFPRDEDGNKVAKPSLEDPVEEWAPWSLVVATKNPHAPAPVTVKPSPGPAWDIGQVGTI